MQVSQFQLKLQNDISYCQLATAFSSTFVVLLKQLIGPQHAKKQMMMSKSGESKKKVWAIERKFQKAGKTILHLDNDSTVLNRYDFQEYIESFLMINSEQMLIPLVKEGTILVIDIRRMIKRRILFYFSERSHVQLFNFPHSNLICIHESFENKKSSFNKNNNQEMIWLSYFRKSDFEMVLQSSLLTSSNKVYQGNHQSLLYLKEKIDKFCEFTLLELTTNKGPFELVIRKVKTPIITSLTGYISGIWSFNREQLLLAYIYSSTQSQITTANIADGTLHNKFCKPLLKKNLKLAIFLQKSVCLKFSNGRYSKSISPSTIEEDTLEFIDAESQKLQFTIKTGKQGGKYSIQKCDFNPSDLIIRQDDTTKSTIKIRVIRSCRLKDIYMHLLLHINQDFDDDLLSDAIDILDSND